MSSSGLQLPALAWPAWLKRPDLDELDELLRRCHRDELLPLAVRVGVSPEGLGLGDLAHAIAVAVRSNGAHLVTNQLLRQGDGPPYPLLLRELCSRCGVEGGETLEETELLLLEWWIDSRWREISPRWRERIWKEMGLEPPVPARREAAGGLARIRLGHHFGYRAVSTLPVLAFLSPVGVLFGLLYFLTRRRRADILPVVLEISRLRQAVRHRVTIGVVGSPSSGKDAAIKAIFGLDSGNVSPIAGSTRDVSITRLEGATALYVVNTPGMGDVVESVTEEARQVLHHIDVFVYVVNSQGGVQAREKSDYDLCIASERPVLAVVNKIDTLRERDRERYLADAREKLGASEHDFLAVAFDPLPQLSDMPIGLDEVRRWLTQELVELGKDPAELPWMTMSEAEGDAE